MKISSLARSGVNVAECKHVKSNLALSPVAFPKNVPIASMIIVYTVYTRKVDVVDVTFR